MARNHRAGKYPPGRADTLKAKKLREQREARGFWIEDPETGLTAHVNGDPNMSEESRRALLELLRAAHKKFLADKRGGSNG